MRFLQKGLAVLAIAALTGVGVVQAQHSEPDTVIVERGAQASSGEQRTPPPGVQRVRDRIAEIRGRRGATQPAEVVYVYPDGTPVPASELPPDAAAQALVQEREIDRQQGTLDRRAMSELMLQLDRRFDRITDRLDDFEDLYYNALRAALARGDQAFFFPEGRGVVTPDGERTLTPDLADDDVVAEFFPERQRITPPPRPGIRVQPQPRADLPPRVREVERALLETGLFRTVEIVFEFDRSDILDGSERTLDAVGDVLERYPDLVVEVAGHTDNIGSAEYNQGLSERRAESVRTYLLEHFDIASDRLIPRGYGLSQPIFSNETPTGRTLNRRVEFVLIEE